MAGNIYKEIQLYKKMGTDFTIPFLIYLQE